MKKAITFVVAAALLTAALLAFVCDNPKFDNPLDKRGENFLEGKRNVDVDGAIGVDGNGVANYWSDTTDKYRPNCDAGVPRIERVGDHPARITNVEFSKFQMYMHLDGNPWDNLIRVVENDGGVTKSAILTKSGNVDEPDRPNQNNMPANGTYTIVYIAQKEKCGEVIPEDRVIRTLIVEEPPDEIDCRELKIELLGTQRVEILKDSVSTYKDRGVTITLLNSGGNVCSFASENLTATAFDSAVIKKGSTRVAKVVSISAIYIPTNAAVNDEYTITYYAHATNKNGDLRTATAERTVKVNPMPEGGKPKPVIVLNPYRSTFGSKTIDHLDTMVFFRGSYREKGVKEVYYMKDGSKISVSTSLVVKTPSTPSVSGPDPREVGITYNLTAGAGAEYGDATPVTRTVYVVDDGCDEAISPDIDLLPAPGGPIEIVAGAVWNHKESWRVTSKDNVENGVNFYGSTGIQYIIDFDGIRLDPNKPEAGTYAITYVGLSKCGALSTKPRTVTVR